MNCHFLCALLPNLELSRTKGKGKNASPPPSWSRKSYYSAFTTHLVSYSIWSLEGFVACSMWLPKEDVGSGMSRHTTLNIVLYNNTSVEEAKLSKPFSLLPKGHSFSHTTTTTTTTTSRQSPSHHDFWCHPNEFTGRCRPIWRRQDPFASMVNFKHIVDQAKVEKFALSFDSSSPNICAHSFCFALCWNIESRLWQGCGRVEAE